MRNAARRRMSCETDMAGYLVTGSVPNRRGPPYILRRQFDEATVNSWRELGFSSMGDSVQNI